MSLCGLGIHFDSFLRFELIQNRLDLVHNSSRTSEESLKSCKGCFKMEYKAKCDKSIVQKQVDGAMEPDLIGSYASASGIGGRSPWPLWFYLTARLALRDKKVLIDLS